MIDLSAQHGLALQRQVTALPRLPVELTAEQRLELVLEEAALLDFVTSFAQLVNAGDVEAVVSCYAEDGIWLSPRGRFEGSEEIRRNYALYFSPLRWFTFWTNVMVRFSNTLDEAYVAAYQYSIGVREDDPLRFGAVSTDVWHVRRAARTALAWQILERRIDILDSHDHGMLPKVGS